MKTVTRYRADDGSYWDTAEQAIHRDHLHLEIGDAMRPMGDRAKKYDRLLSMGHHYIQHTEEAVLAVKGALLRLCRRELSGHEVFSLPPEEVHNRSIAGRIIDDSQCEPIRRAWWRLMCTDEEHREWEQPYYASHPQPGATALTMEQ